MKVTKKLLEKSIIELVIEENAKEIAKHRKKALAYLEENADIKGFRKGSSIPESVIIKNYGEEHIAKMTVDFAIDSLYRQALKKEKLIPVAQGEIKEVISESPLKFKAHIEVFPQIEISDKYKKIKLKKTKVSVSAEEVKQALSEIETRFTKFEEINDKKYKASMWDKVTVDTDGYEKDKILESTSMRDYPLVLGSKMLVPWFEEGLVWAKIGDELELDITFPKDYHNKDFADKKTKFKVKVKKIEKSKKPEFTPEFIEQLRWQKLDLTWFKKLIWEEIKETKEANARMEEENKLIEELLKVTKVDIWEKLIANKTEQVYSEIKENITKDWIKINDYLESLKLTEEQYKEKNVQPIAIKRLQWELILHKLMEIEKIEVSESEMKKEIEGAMKKFSSPDVLEKLKDLYKPWTKYYEELKLRASYRKLIDKFFEKENKKS